MFLLTQDSNLSAKIIARALGLTDRSKEFSPNGRRKEIQVRARYKMRGWQNQKKVVWMNFFKKKIISKSYDKENKKPVIRASICNGEQVAGFKDIHTGKIEEVMLIKSPADFNRFKEMYGIDEEITKEY